MKTIASLFVLTLLAATPAIATTQTTTAYDKEELKKDYKAFLQQLKSLNSQYKEITGEISTVMKEEGVPTWDMGDASVLGEKPEDKTNQTQDLGGGIILKESEKEMLYTIDLPGYKKDMIKLTYLGNGKLTIKASRKVDQINRTYERTIDLPTLGDQKGTYASYEDGVLTVKIPKLATKEVVIPVR